MDTQSRAYHDFFFHSNHALAKCGGIVEEHETMTWDDAEKYAAELARVHSTDIHVRLDGDRQDCFYATPGGVVCQLS